MRLQTTIPDKDNDVIEWLKIQENVSYSLRTVIRQSIARDGMIDITCKPIANPGVFAGRPRKQEDIPVQIKDEEKMSDTVKMQSTDKELDNRNNQNQEIESSVENDISFPVREEKTVIKTDSDGFVDPSQFL